MTLKDQPRNQVLPGDCIEVLQGLPAESVDLVFADPPYNLQLHQELRRPDQSRVEPVNDHWDQFEDFAAYDRFTERWLSACRRVLKPHATLWVIGTYHNIYRIGKILQDLEFWLLNDIVWIKSNPMPNFRGVRFTNAHETMIWAQKERGAPYTFNHHAMKALNEDLQMRSDWYLPICSGKERLRKEGQRAHPTQKPEALIYRVIQASSNPGDVVLDPFFGTGTTGVIAKRLHRDWIGIEREPAYIELAEERIRNETLETFEESVFETPSRRKQARVPFSSLLESGMLRPGQILFFGEKGEKTAVVHADGKIICEDQRGSIHQVARKLKGTPCNGWEHWYYSDEESREKMPIDNLRALYRKEYIEKQT